MQDQRNPKFAQPAQAVEIKSNRGAAVQVNNKTQPSNSAAPKPEDS